MADIRELQNFYRGKKVLITGHTGFKGAWLAHVLLGLGARVIGVSLPPQTPDDIFITTGLDSYLTSYMCDVRKLHPLKALVATEKPDVVFHLAAQPLVRRSYDEPHLTMTTNVIGTANVLEAVRYVPHVQAAVIVTTDKVYENRESHYAYRENDPLGGHDPYSGSKAAADIVTQTYSKSFFNPGAYGMKHQTLIASARAGNVIGGGDWAVDRLVPDIMRSVFRGDGIITLRNPDAIRPWEHVLEPVVGYLMLGARLGSGEREFSGAWNFGPSEEARLPVGEMTKRMVAFLGSGNVQVIPDAMKHEAGLLMLDPGKANQQLGWKSRWQIDRVLEETARWYRVVESNSKKARDITGEQIAAYFSQ